MKINKKNKDDNNKEKTILEKRKIKREKKKKILKHSEINLDKKSKQTNLEILKIDKINNNTNDYDVFSELNQDLEEHSKKIKRIKITFTELVQKFQKKTITSMINFINEISAIIDEKILEEKILQQKTEDIQNTLILLDSLIISFDNEFKNTSYDEIIFAILDKKTKDFPKEIIKNILETKCHELIFLLLKEENKNNSSVKKDVYLAM